MLRLDGGPLIIDSPECQEKLDQILSEAQVPIVLASDEMLSEGASQDQSTFTRLWDSMDKKIEKRIDKSVQREIWECRVNRAKAAGESVRRFKM